MDELTTPSTEPKQTPPEGGAPASTEPVLKKEEAERLRKHLQRLVRHISNAPGVYKMLDELGHVLYVGKAKDLRKRVSSYFRPSNTINGGHTTKTVRMVAKIRDIQTISVSSEVEALLLETNLIKEHRPPYNILMRDDKNYAYLKITYDEDFPRIYAVRSIAKDTDRARYFGPYLNASLPIQSLEFLKRIFPFRTCTGQINVLGPGKKPLEKVEVETVNIPRTPCLLFHMKRCVAPCIGRVTPEEYRAIVKNVEEILDGKGEHLIAAMREEMQHAAQDKEFERAAKLRDRVQALEQMQASQEQVVSATKLTSQDILNFATDSGVAACVLLRIRGGKLIDSQQTSFRINPDVSQPEEILDAMLSQYYTEALDIPDEILVPAEPPSREALEQLLTDRRKKNITIRVPQRGDAMRLLLLARQNAAHHLEETRIKWMNEEKRTVAAARDLGEKLGVAQPTRIECYDISHVQGTSKVGSMVVFVDGAPSKGQYRRFHIKSLAEGVNDDFASLAEVLRRRLSYLLEEERARQLAVQEAAPTVKKINRSKLRTMKKKEDESFKAVPDLIIIDGGKGQLSSVMSVVQELGLNDLAVVSLAKREEEIFVPGKSEPVLLEPYSEALYLVQRIRDEAHRFAISFHRNVRSKKMVRSRLDEVPGLGPAAKKKLLSTFGSMRAVKEASEEDVAAIVGKGLAVRIKDLL